MKYTLIVGFLLWSNSVFAQMLYPENFTFILDTSKTVEGSITPDFKIQTQKELLVEVEAVSDLAVNIKNTSLTFANKVEWQKFGEEIILSGGYVYGETNLNITKSFITELFAQMHWAESRGLQTKYAGGVKIRFKMVQNENMGLFFGTGPFYEYENWNYDGLDENETPDLPPPVINKLLKLGSYITYKQHLFQKIFFDTSIYHQARFNEIFNLPRLGSSSQLSYEINQYVELVAIYQNLYDYNPVVPIEPWYHKIITSVAISF